MVSSMYGGGRIRDMRVAESIREDEFAETWRKIGLGGVVGGVGMGDVVDVGAGYVEEDWVLSDGSW